jgi:hypothetical protein
MPELKDKEQQAVTTLARPWPLVQSKRQTVSFSEAAKG